jgi:hypothetical protein
MPLPEIDQEYLLEKKIRYELLSEGARLGLVVKDYILPRDKYNIQQADILVLLPSGYPDASPDMFYVHPDLILTAIGRPANAANVTFSFGGITWQRWSRHAPGNIWRPGIDGIHTYLKRIDSALHEAK